MPSLIPSFTYSAYIRRHVRAKPFPRPQDQRNEMWYCLHGTNCLRDTSNKPYGKRKPNGHKCTDCRGALRKSGRTRAGFSEEVTFLLELER